MDRTTSAKKRQKTVPTWIHLWCVALYSRHLGEAHAQRFCVLHLEMNNRGYMEPLTDACLDRFITSIVLV